MYTQIGSCLIHSTVIAPFFQDPATGKSGGSKILKFKFMSKVHTYTAWLGLSPTSKRNRA